MIHQRFAWVLLASRHVFACATQTNELPLDVPPAQSSSAGAHSGGSSGATSVGGGGTSGAVNGGGNSGAVATSVAGGAASGGSTSASAGSGASGSSSAAGAGGSDTSTVSGSEACADTPSFHVDYQSQTADSVITIYFHLYNDSGSEVALSSLAVRYFFSQEESSWKNLQIYTSQKQGSYENLIANTQITVQPLSAPANGATHYVELTFSGSSATLPSSASDYVEIGANLEPDYDPPNQNESDDYSYDAAHTTYATWQNIATYEQGALAGGCEPSAP